ncbi:MAG: hypothetical protein WC901_06680, partial [Candidatus Margulisiibacteriota bacterium]
MTSIKGNVRPLGWGATLLTKRDRQQRNYQATFSPLRPMQIRIRTHSFDHLIITPDRTFKASLPETEGNVKYHLLRIDAAGEVLLTLPLPNDSSSVIRFNQQETLTIDRKHDTFTFINASGHEVVDIAMELRSVGIHPAPNTMGHNQSFLAAHPPAGWGMDRRQEGSPPILPKRRNFGITQEGKLILLPCPPTEIFVVAVFFVYTPAKGLDFDLSFGPETSSYGYDKLRRILQQTVDQ